MTGLSSHQEVGSHNPCGGSHLSHERVSHNRTRTALRWRFFYSLGSRRRRCFTTRDHSARRADPVRGRWESPVATHSTPGAWHLLAQPACDVKTSPSLHTFARRQAPPTPHRVGSPDITTLATRRRGKSPRSSRTASCRWRAGHHTPAPCGLRRPFPPLSDTSAGRTSSCRPLRHPPSTRPGNSGTCGRPPDA